MKFNFSKKELRDLVISWIVLSTAFSVLLNGAFPIPFYWVVFTALLTVGIGFIFHELGHRFVAIHYGAQARFVMWPTGLILALITSFLGFLFAAPGAVYIYKEYLNARENGIISVAGPAINLVSGFILFIIFILLNIFQINSIIILSMLILAAYINALLALFNLLPIFILDGAKVFRWNILVWVIMFAAAIGLFFTTSFFL